jgi:hypothetical protein
MCPFLFPNRSLENDAREGFRNMYTGILANCQAHVISATLAHYIVRHGSRFRYSHDFAYIPVAQYENYFRNMEIWTPLQFAKEGRFAIGSNIINYLHRPQDLEDECNICFFINFKQARLSKKLKESGEFFSFLPTHPSKDTYCIIERENSDSILPEIPFCLLPDLSKVGPIFPEYNQQFTVAQHTIRERYAMFVCLLIFPFRVMSDIKEGEFM